MRAIWLLTVIYSLTGTVFAEEPQCNAVLPLGIVTAFPKFVNVDGTLLLDGKSQCVVVNIECQRDLGSCSHAATDVTLTGPIVRVSRIYRSVFPIRKWDSAELVASGESGLCGWTEIYINIANKTARLTTTTSTARRGCNEVAKSELFKSVVNNKTQVFDIGSDPFWTKK